VPPYAEYSHGWIPPDIHSTVDSVGVSRLHESGLTSLSIFGYNSRLDDARDALNLVMDLLPTYHCFDDALDYLTQRVLEND
jgi:hypothetical protein